MTMQTKQSLLTNAFEILMHNLGPHKATRLWQILTPLDGNYVTERKVLFKGKSVSSLYKQSLKFNKK